MAGSAQRVLVVGAGGFGREVMQYLHDMSKIGIAVEPVGFLDSNPDALNESNVRLPIVSSIEAYRPRDDERLVLAVGDPAVRQRLAEQLASRGAKFCSVVHPRSYVADTAELGEGCVLAPFAFVGAALDWAATWC